MTCRVCCRVQELAELPASRGVNEDRRNSLNGATQVLGGENDSLIWKWPLQGFTAAAKRPAQQVDPVNLAFKIQTDLLQVIQQPGVGIPETTPGGRQQAFAQVPPGE